MKKGDHSPALAIAKVVEPPASAKIMTMFANITCLSKSTKKVSAASKINKIQQNDEDDDDDDDDDDDKELYNADVDDDDDDYK